MWGAATSSHQIEGGNDNDWTRWENQGKIKNKEKSGKAANSWNLYKRDFDLLEKLNLNAYRFSIEWSRIEPEQGKFDQKAIDKYKAMIKDLKSRGITPIVTLHHFTNPKWLNAWTDKYNVNKFKAYVEKVVEEFGDDVKYWVTINEPGIFVSLGYQKDIWPPGFKNRRDALRALRNIHQAHRAAYISIHQIYKENEWNKPMVSMAFNMQYFEPVGNSILNKIATKMSDYFVNRYSYNKVKSYLDYIGLNYYFSHKVNIRKLKSITELDEGGFKKSDLGWDMNPDGLYGVLLSLKKKKLPVIITENGLADARDINREWFIKEHLKAVARAMHEGVNVKGYMHWSLIDNFEWADGFGPRFGLAEVDYKKFKRTPRKSSSTYAKIAKTNSLEIK